MELKFEKEDSLNVGVLKQLPISYNSYMGIVDDLNQSKDRRPIYASITQALERFDIVFSPSYSFSVIAKCALEQIVNRSKGKDSLIIPGLMPLVSQKNNYFMGNPLVYDGKVVGVVLKNDLSDFDRMLLKYSKGLGAVKANRVGNVSLLSDGLYDFKNLKLKMYTANKFENSYLQEGAINFTSGIPFSRVKNKMQKQIEIDPEVGDMMVVSVDNYCPDGNKRERCSITNIISDRILYSLNMIEKKVWESYVVPKEVLSNYVSHND